MFSGIVVGVGSVSKAIARPGALSILVSFDLARTTFDYSLIKQGDSFCVSGVCLTVVGVEIGEHPGFWFDVSDATLSCTCGLDREGSLVNLEPSLQVGSPVDGHFVFGHVDCVGTIVGWEPVGACVSMVVSIPRLLAAGVVKKGSIAISGISLTVNTVEDRSDEVLFGINLIPYTLSQTTASSFQVSTKVNVEIDMLSRYVARYAEVFLNK